MRRVRPKTRLAAPALALAVALLAAPGTRGFAPPPSTTPDALFAPATQLSGLPTNAVTGASELATLDAVSCPAAGSCLVGGTYDDQAGQLDTQAMVANETNGTWGPVSELALPQDAATGTGAQLAAVTSVSCWSPGNCEAVGFYTDSSGDGEAMAASETNGAWAQALRLALPADAATTAGAQQAALGAAACPSAGNCTAVGQYTDATGAGLPIVASESNGAWGAASKIALPDDAGPAQNAALIALACTSVGNCVAGGGYSDSHSPADTKPMAAIETNGSWGPASLVGVEPSGAALGQQIATIESVTCSAPIACLGSGSYLDPHDNRQAMLGTLTVPSGAVPGGAAFAGPTGAQQADLMSVACPTAAGCVAVGSFSTSAGTTPPSQAMVASQTGGQWNTPSPVTLPAGAAPAASQQADLGAVSCPTTGLCVAAGTYTDGGGGVDPMIVSSAPPLSITAPALLPVARVGAPYRTQLAAAGGAGAYSWLLASGAPPPGLALSPSGVISGVPTTPTPANPTGGGLPFTLTVDDAGPPAQSASGVFSIVVLAAEPRPLTPAPPTVSAMRVHVTRATVRVAVTCHGAGAGSCTGTLTLTTVEHLRGHRLTALTARHSRSVTVTLARARYAVPAGTTVTVTLAPRAAERRLLARHRSVPAKLALTPTGRRTPTRTERLSLHRR